MKRITLSAAALAAILFGCDLQTGDVKAFLREQQLQSVAATVIDPSRIFRNSTYDAWQLEAAKEQGIDVLLAKAVRVKESFDEPGLVSTTGAVGLMQLMPTSTGTMYTTENYENYLQARQRKDRMWNGKRHLEWAALYQADLETLRDATPLDELAKRDQRFDAQWNIRQGTRHLVEDIEHFGKKYPDATDEDVARMAVAAYYTGRGRIAWAQTKGAHIPKDTQPYVEDVLRVYGRLQQGLPPR